MSAKSVIVSIVAGVICSVLIMAGLLFFIGPIFLPGLTNKDTDLQNKYDELLEQYNDLLNNTSELEENDLVLQYKYQEWESNAWIPEYNLTYQKMNETELSITIQENSRLYISFSSLAYLYVTFTFSTKALYSIALVVDGFGNRTSSVRYFGDPAVSSYYREYVCNLNIDYLTGPLSAGTYDIAMYWKSSFDSVDYSYLSVADPGYENTRSLWVMELKTP